MATFLELQTRVMRSVNRPMSETNVLDGAKDAINDAIIETQRDHAFSYTENLATFDYPVQTLFVDIGTVCGGTLRDVITIQQMASGQTFEGKPIKVIKYSTLQAMRGKIERRSPAVDAEFFRDALNIEREFCQDKIAWIVNKNIGIYPLAQQAASFLINFHTWLSPLEDDEDDNFLTSYAPDYIVAKALRLMQTYIKDAGSFAPSDAIIQESWAKLLAWDSQLNETTTRSMG